jgi:hypothetical protein
VNRSLRLVGCFVVASGLLLLAFATASPAAAAKPCWRQVLDDWTDNTRLDKEYAIGCYNEALANIPDDIEAYTDAYDQISNARQDALRGDNDRGLSSASPGGGGDDDPGGGSDGGPLGEILGIGTDSSDSIPLPLVILGALAGLLMAAGAAGLVARKLQARRAGAPEPPE